MRFLPLVDSGAEAAAWGAFPDVELAWTGRLDPGWHGRAVHAIHLPAGGDLDTAFGALRPRLGQDFLVLPADPPSTRWGLSGFLGHVEALLEACSGSGTRLALRAAPGSLPRVLEILRDVKGDAVGFCWDAAVGPHLELITERLLCAVGTSDVDPRPLQHWGYRWNMAIPGGDPAAMAGILSQLQERHPGVLFPADLGERP